MMESHAHTFSLMLSTRVQASLYNAFPSSCNFQLQQCQPCEPIREQNSKCNLIGWHGSHSGKPDVGKTL